MPLNGAGDRGVTGGACLLAAPMTSSGQLLVTSISGRRALYLKEVSAAGRGIDSRPLQYGCSGGSLSCRPATDNNGGAGCPRCAVALQLGHRLSLLFQEKLLGTLCVAPHAHPHITGTLPKSCPWKRRVQGSNMYTEGASRASSLEHKEPLSLRHR